MRSSFSLPVRTNFSDCALAATGYIATNGSVYKTTNGGTSWNMQNLGGFTALLDVHFSDVNNGYAVGNGNVIYSTHDGGTTWSQYFANNVGMLSAVFAFGGQKAWAAGTEGVILQTLDGGLTWKKQLTNRQSTINGMYFTDQNNGWAVGYDGMVLRTTSGGVTGTQEKETVVSARQYSLEQNYPNPFNPVTKIQYVVITQQSSANSRMMVSLKVFDVLGREVATLVNEEKTPGTYTVTFNASSLPSGTYFYELRAGEYRAVRKMILVK